MTRLRGSSFTAGSGRRFSLGVCWLGLASLSFGVGCRDRESSSLRGVEVQPVNAPAVVLGRTGEGQPPDARAMGDRIEAGEYVLTVEGLKECRLPFVRDANTIVGVEVRLEGLAEREIPINPFYGRLVDTEQNTYRPTLSGCDPRLKASRLGAGDRAHGYINFELPRRASGLVFRYEPAPSGAAAVSVSVAVDR